MFLSLREGIGEEEESPNKEVLDEKVNGFRFGNKLEDENPAKERPVTSADLLETSLMASRSAHKVPLLNTLPT
jgi:hypothetical protein